MTTSPSNKQKTDALERPFCAVQITYRQSYKALTISPPFKQKMDAVGHDMDPEVWAMICWVADHVHKSGMPLAFLLLLHLCVWARAFVYSRVCVHAYVCACVRERVFVFVSVGVLEDS